MVRPGYRYESILQLKELAMVDWVQRGSKLGVKVIKDHEPNHAKYIMEFPNGYMVWCYEEHQVAEELEDFRNGNGAGVAALPRV